MAGYPDLEGFAYQFSRGEISLGRKIYTAITNVSFAQPTTNAGVFGTRPWPIAQTEGDMELGEGTITFSDEAERQRFLDDLGNGYRSKTWKLSWILTAKGRPPIKFTCYGCKVNDDPVEHERGEEALGGDVTFSFMSFTRNGKAPHEGMPNPG